MFISKEVWLCMLSGLRDFFFLFFFFLSGKSGYSAEKSNRGQCLEVQVLFQVSLQQHAAGELCGKFCLRISGVYGFSQLSHSLVIWLLSPPNPYISLHVY